MRAAIPQASERRVCRAARTCRARACARHRREAPASARWTPSWSSASASSSGSTRPSATASSGRCSLRRRSSREPQGRLPHPEGQALVRAPAQRDAAPARPGPQERRPGEQRALGDRSHPRLLRRRRLGSPGGDHRLPRPRDRRLGVQPSGPRPRGRARPRGGLPARFGTLRPERPDAGRSGATTGSSSRPAASAPPAATTASARSSSPPTPRSRTA